MKNYFNKNGFDIFAGTSPFIFMMYNRWKDRKFKEEYEKKNFKIKRQL